jgi:hypothetical protein
MTGSGPPTTPVTDEMVDAAWAAWAQAWTTSSGSKAMRAALEAVMPLVPSERRVAEAELEAALNTIAAWPLHERPQTRDERSAYGMQRVARAALGDRSPQT